MSDAHTTPSHRFEAIGIGYLGVVATSIIYGITCIQAFQYYRSPRSKRDTPGLKYLVSALWALDSIQEAFAVHVFYFYLVDGFSDPASSDIPIWSIPAGILVNALVQLFVKTFYAVRIFRISRNYVVAATVGTLNVARFAHVAFLTASSPKTGRPSSDVDEAPKYIGSTGLGMEAVTGILISVWGVYQLLERRGDLYPRQTRGNDIISRLVMLTIATGSLSALFVIGDFISYVAAPTKFYVLFFNMLIAKLDINALLTSLNCRDLILRVEDRSAAISLSMPIFVHRSEVSQCDAHNATAQGATSGKNLERTSA
ncbi:hypothetical protein GSI_14373 [Ganoderma sinense ZZ0214-1]|uniref:DUF6534 domain-containing protein n=1 Tax=Ganoderma sinense ZZ0214-1 TaxID=1077348 RepID=A0A2G8RNH9_9APHY|nr:hypothetical protein GSI_14373 [Ganoderma sinense ZZ0214-1]